MTEVSETDTIKKAAEHFLNSCSPAWLYNINRQIQDVHYQDIIRNWFEKNVIVITATEYCDQCGAAGPTTPNGLHLLCYKCLAKPIEDQTLID